MMRLDMALEDIDKAFAKLDTTDKAVRLGVVYGLNKLATQGVNQGVRSITQQYNIKKGDVKKGITIKKATLSIGHLHAVIESTGRSFPLIKFGASPSSPVSQVGIPKGKKGSRPYPGRKRASVKVRKQGARIKLKHAFVARMASGHVGVFERPTKRTLPIKEMHSIGVSGMFKAASVKTIKHLVRTRGPAIIRHEIGYQLSKRGNK